MKKRYYKIPQRAASHAHCAVATKKIHAAAPMQSIENTVLAHPAHVPETASPTTIIIGATASAGSNTRILLNLHSIQKKWDLSIVRRQL